MSVADPILFERIERNVRDIRARMQAAYDRANRTDRFPTLVAVTKYAPVVWLEVLYELGLRDFGESRPQQLKQRAAWFGESRGRTDVRWHQIGQLQRNKASLAVENAAWIHSVDSFRLLEQVTRLIRETACPPQLLLQVNISGEESKSGFSPAELRDHAAQLRQLKPNTIAGLMTMAPLTDDPAVVARVFSGLREYRDQLRQQLDNELPLAELSMGMSGDFEVAIAEGATLVRIGSGLFEGCEELSNSAKED